MYRDHLIFLFSELLLLAFCSRFIVNIPDLLCDDISAKEAVVRFFFQLELAWWFYDDNYKDDFESALVSGRSHTSRKARTSTKKASWV